MTRIIALLALISAVFGTSPSMAATATVTAETCAQLTEHVADADVTYRPGVDVDGNAVASATIGGGFQVKPPTEIKIPIQISPGPGSSLYSTSDTTVGTVTYKNGRVYYNGRPVQDEEAARISRLCQQQLKAGGSAKIPHPHRQ